MRARPPSVPDERRALVEERAGAVDLERHQLAQLRAGRRPRRGRRARRRSGRDPRPGGRRGRPRGPRRRPASARRAGARCRPGRRARSGRASRRRRRGGRARRPGSPRGRSSRRARRTSRRRDLPGRAGWPRSAASNGPRGRSSSRTVGCEPAQHGVRRGSPSKIAVEVGLEARRAREPVALDRVAELVDEPRVAVDRDQVASVVPAEHERGDREVLPGARERRSRPRPGASRPLRPSSPVAASAIAAFSRFRDDAGQAGAIPKRQHVVNARSTGCGLACAPVRVGVRAVAACLCAVAGSGCLGLAPAAAVARSLRPCATATGIHKIKHVVIIMQENRSFDSFFGTFPGADGIPMRNGVPTVCVPDPVRSTAASGRSTPLPTASAGGPARPRRRGQGHRRREDGRLHPPGPQRAPARLRRLRPDARPARSHRPTPPP